MTTAPVIRSHSHTVRFDSSHRMTGRMCRTLLSNAAAGLSAGHIEKWRFVVANDPDQRRRIREAAWDRDEITDASMLVILCADLKAWRDEPLHYWHKTAAPLREFNVPCGRQCFHGLDRAQRDAVMRTCGMAAQSFAGAARDKGFTACPIDSVDFMAVADVINLPDDFAVCLLIAIGRAGGAAAAEAEEVPLDEVMVTDRF